MDASTDHGTIIEREAAALVANADGSLSLLVPPMAEGAFVPEAVLVLTALLIRLEKDEGFREEQLEWFARQTTA